MLVVAQPEANWSAIRFLEPLTFEKTDWLTIPSNTIAVITPSLNVLLYPIKDKYHTADKRKTWV